MKTFFFWWGVTKKAHMETVWLIPLDTNQTSQSLISKNLEGLEEVIIQAGHNKGATEHEFKFLNFLGQLVTFLIIKHNIHKFEKQFKISII